MKKRINLPRYYGNDGSFIVDDLNPRKPLNRFEKVLKALSAGWVWWRR